MKRAGLDYISLFDLVALLKAAQSVAACPVRHVFTLAKWGRVWLVIQSQRSRLYNLRYEQYWLEYLHEQRLRTGSRT